MAASERKNGRWISKVWTFFKSRANSNQIVALSALLISLFALIVSIIEMRTMQIQQKALVYPHLDGGGHYDKNGFAFKVKNSGTGLAIVKSVEVFNDRQAFKRWEELIDFYLPEKHSIDYGNMGTGQINGKVIPPGEEVRMFWVNWNDDSRRLVDSLYYVRYRICYCSFLDDCWFISKEESTPVPTRKCEAGQENSF